MVGTAILQQLGGLRFQTLTGARDFVSQNDGLSFRVPRASTGIAHIRVIVAPDDTYSVTFLDKHASEVARIDGLDADELRATMAQHIGCALD
jgi:hypothetical protein